MYTSTIDEERGPVCLEPGINSLIPEFMADGAHSRSDGSESEDKLVFDRTLRASNCPLISSTEVRLQTVPLADVAYKLGQYEIWTA